MWIIMGFFFIAQNFASVANSRARNGDSYGVHAVTNVMANGLYIASLYFITGKFFEQYLKGGNLYNVVGFITFFCVCQLTGGLLSHWFMKTFVERER